MMSNNLEEMKQESEDVTSPNTLVASLNELSSKNDFNKDFKNKPTGFRVDNKTPFFYPNPSTHIPYFPNQSTTNYPFFSPYQMNAKNFYSLNMFAKPAYQDRRNYLKVKKEQNIHKLWPHSAPTNPETAIVNKETGSCATNAKPEQANDQVSQTDQWSEIEPNKKTPMCLIHELVKFNKIKHEYILLDEKGPAHKKTFYVELKLGAGTNEEECYQANESSIKKAQHKAAEIALNETKFTRPVSRARPYTGSKKIIITAKKENEQKHNQSNTVKLNSLCMKHGLKANYEHMSVPVVDSIYTSFNNAEIKPFVYQPPQIYVQNRNFAFKKNSSRAHRLNRFGVDVPCKVKLKLASEEFVAEGETVQKARHNVAAMALEFLSKEDNLKKIKQFFNKSNQMDENNSTKNVNGQYSQSATENQESKVKILSHVKAESDKQEKIDTMLESLTRHKSEISILLEFCLRFKRSISFELVNESGPSHIKKFVTKCSIGANNSSNDEYLEVLGEGNSKKQSKQKSAIEMLKIIGEKFPHSLESLYLKKETITNSDAKQSNAEKKKRKTKSNIIVANKTSPEYGSGTINPITRLIQIQHANKKPEPVFELVSSINRYKKNDVTKSRSEFCMSVSVWVSKDEQVKCEAKGPNKKTAKQNAAEAMLIKLGYPTQQTQIKPSLKNSDENAQKLEKKVKFVDPNGEGDQEQKDVIKIKSFVPNKIKLYKDQLSDRTAEVNVLLGKDEFQMCANISKELVESIEKNDGDFYSHTAEDYLSQREQGLSVISAKDFNETESGKAKLKILTNGSEGNYKAALDYLANIFNFKCNYQSILGRDKSVNSYLSLSILSNTDKPFSGQGATRVQSSNLAAAAALKYLANYNQPK